MRVIICGGRDFNDTGFIVKALDRFHAERPITLVTHGAAPGADTIAGKWALLRGIDARAMPADWSKHGRAAGPMRNQAMIETKPDAVIAFPGGRGTADMKRRAKAAGVPVFIPAAPQEPTG